MDLALSDLNHAIASGTDEERAEFLRLILNIPWNDDGMISITVGQFKTMYEAILRSNAPVRILDSVPPIEDKTP